ncbi:MAG: BrnT family toxin [bacterium]
MQYNFEWNPEKAKVNIKKHGVRFEYSATVFKDPQAVSIYDDDHSINEDRWITLGIASNGILLTVHHTYNQVDDKNVVIRIISSRRATSFEKRQYEEEKR